MKLLAFDTSTEACSAALYIDGAVIERYELAPRAHARLLLPMIESLLAEARIGVRDLDALACGRGPGAFTGVRIAAGVAQGIAFGADLPVALVSSLAALAQGMYAEKGATQVLACIDARMSEVYWGAYTLDEEGCMRVAGAEILCKPADAPPPDEGLWHGAGSGWAAYHAALNEKPGACLAGWEGERYPRASAVAVLGAASVRRGELVTAENVIPVYLRDEVAHKAG